MGMRFSTQDSEQLIQAMKNNVQIANTVTDRLSSGCDHLIQTLNSGELEGAAYTAGKGLFSEVIIPSIKKLQSAIDDIQAEISAYEYAHSVVAEYDTLDMNNLKKQLNIKYQQLDEVEAQLRRNQDFFHQTQSLFVGNLGDVWAQNYALEQLKQHLEIGIEDVKTRINKLEWFVSDVSKYFSDSLQVLNLAIKGATELSKLTVDINGNYYSNGADMSWLSSMTKTTIHTYGMGDDPMLTLIRRNAKELMLSEKGEAYYRKQLQSLLAGADAKDWPLLIQSYNGSLLFDDDGNILFVSPVQYVQGDIWLVLKNGKVDSDYTTQLNQERANQFWASLGDNALEIFSGLASVLGGTATGLGSTVLGAGGFALALPSGGTVTVPAEMAAAAGFAISCTLITGGTIAISDAFSKMAVTNANIEISFAKDYDNYTGGIQRSGRQKGNAPRSSQAQNKQIDDIVKKYKLSKMQRKRLHSEITGQGYGFKEIVEIAKEIANGK